MIRIAIMRINISIIRISLFSLSFFFLCHEIPFADDSIESPKPVVVITDLYHPYQDRGDNFDLISGYALSEIDLKAIILDTTDAFRKKTADHPTLWKDPGGPREAGIIPVMQLNSIFNRDIPFAVGPMSMMRSPDDQMRTIPGFQQAGIDLLIRTIEKSDVPVEIASFGSARPLAVAYNRRPDLFLKKVRMVHLSAGTAMNDFGPITDHGSSLIPGGEWNVALDVYAFTRILRSDLSVSIYPCGGIGGAFVKYRNNTYWQLNDMRFVSEMDPKLARYIDFALTKRLAYDFLRVLDEETRRIEPEAYPMPFAVWETPVWIAISGREIVRKKDGRYRIVKKREIEEGDRVIPYKMIPCRLDVRDDGRFVASETDGPTPFRIYFRPDPEEQEAALQEALPHLMKSFRVD